MLLQFTNKPQPKPKPKSDYKPTLWRGAHINGNSIFVRPPGTVEYRVSQNATPVNCVCPNDEHQRR